jgi:non-heme chloroperoxidase
MSALTSRDGTQIFFKDWGEGQPIVFSHGWPLSGDAWDNQMLFFGERGHRVIAHDRRGHGRSSQPWHGNDMNTWAADLAQLIDKLDLRNVILVGHSTGGGEVTRYVAKHGASRVAKVVLLSAIPPLMLKTANNPSGLPMDAFDAIRKGVAQNRAQFLRDLAIPFYGFNRSGAKISEGLQESFWLSGMQASVKAVYDSVKQFSETDFTDDLKRFEVPTLIAHGDDDQIVPIVSAALLSAKLVKRATLKIYKGAPHGLAQTIPDQFNADLLAFIQSRAP